MPCDVDCFLYLIIRHTKKTTPHTDEDRILATANAASVLLVLFRDDVCVVRVWDGKHPDFSSVEGIEHCIPSLQTRNCLDI